MKSDLLVFNSASEIQVFRSQKSGFCLLLFSNIAYISNYNNSKKPNPERSRDGKSQFYCCSENVLYDLVQ
jgi:hypothetical protein